MANLRIEWDGDYQVFTNRHLPRELHRRMKRIAGELDTSIEVVMNEVIRVGLPAVEHEIFTKNFEDGNALQS